MMLTLVSLFVISASFLCFTTNAKLLVGQGIADVTGPVADVNFMGYAQAKQKGKGIHFRLRSRAFVFSTESKKIFAFVSVDFGMASGVVTNQVVTNLEANPVTKGLFSHKNICISGTHTH
eukprot:GSMAST32.ASY1.ANO1.669.1 assembled CDS